VPTQRKPQKKLSLKLCVFLDENLPPLKPAVKQPFEVHRIVHHVKPMTRDVRVFEFLKRWAQRKHTEIVFLTRDKAFRGSINYRTHRAINIIILQSPKGKPKNYLASIRSKPLQQLLQRVLRRYSATLSSHP